MQNAIWSAVAGSVYQMRRLDVIANNLANVNTVGFRGDRIDFQANLSQIRARQFQSARHGLHDINQMIHTHSTFQRGLIQPTGNPLDLALDGRGFFVIQAPDGERFTRAGDFHLDQNGQIVTDEGFVVQGEGGPITLRDDAGPPEITEEGAVFQNQEEVGRLRIVEVENPETLVKVTGRTFRSAPATHLADTTETLVIPRSLESSNVNLVREMVEMLQANRAFESYQRVITMVNTMNQQANTRIPQLG